MVSRLFYIGILFLILYGCAPLKNEYAQLRFKSKRFTIKPNKSVILNTKIDTSSFYLKVLEDDRNYMYDIKNQKKEIKNFGIGIKFYSGGKVGLFNNVDIKNKETLDPKKATMGYYEEINGELFLEFIFNHVQSGNYLVKNKIFLIENDSVKIKSYKKAISPEHLAIYKKIELPNEFLIYTPDW